MKRCLGKGSAIIGLVLIMASACGAALSGTIDGRLQDKLNTLGPQELIGVNVVLNAQADPADLARLGQNLSKRDARGAVVAELKRIASDSQKGVLRDARELESRGQAAEVRSLWLVNAVSLKATPSAVRDLARRPEVGSVTYNERVFALIDADKPARATTAGGSFRSAPADTAWGVTWIGAPDVWRQGYRGQGILVAIVDTGIWYTHTDLTNRMWHNPGEIPNNGRDDDHNGYIDDYYGYSFSYHTSDPIDVYGHGTHVSGTVAGDGTAGTLTGVAPQATLMACKVLDNGGYGDEATCWEGMQYALDNGADVISMSLGWIHFVHYPTRDAWRNACNNIAAGGMVMCVAAGNERGWYNPPDDVRTPGDCPPPWLHPDQTLRGGTSAVITVGATGYHNDTYAYFSSQGPVTWGTIAPWFDYAYNPGMGLIDPDVCAPGENVNSTVRGGGYSGDTWSGTSMATPHTAGTVALMLSKNPYLSPAGIDSILEKTALDRGATGKDNDYGSGRIRALSAVSSVPGIPTNITVTVTPDSTAVHRGGTLSYTVAVFNNNGTPQSVESWSDVTLPAGKPYFANPVDGPLQLTLDPFQTLSSHLSHTVPTAAKVGTYTLTSSIGDWPSFTLTSDQFTFTVVGD